MLARGVLCRLAADVPKTTHDLPRLSHLLRTTLLSANGASPPAVRALSHAYKAALFEYRRSYATSAGTTKPAAKAKSSTKKAAAKEPAKKVVAKKSKKTAAKKKAAAKPKRVKKVLTPEEKELQTIKQYQQKALKAPLVSSSVSSWMVFVGEAVKGATGSENVKTRIKEAGPKFKALTPEEKAYYEGLASEQTAANRAKYDAWVRSYSPEEIRVANLARAYLKRKAKAGVKRIPKNQLYQLHDDRQVKKPASAYILFSAERRRSDQHKGVTTTEFNKICVDEWKALDPSEKKKYEDQSAEEHAAYKREFENIYGHAPRSP